MRVPVEQKSFALSLPGRDMNQIKGFPASLKDQASGKIQPEIVVAQDAFKRPADRPHSRERGQIAKVAEVPDLIGFPERGQRRTGKLSMGICNDGDA